MGWFISISIFTFLIVCVKPPSDSNERISLSTPKNDALVEGDVHVKCEIITPFKDKSSNALAAHGTIDITAHIGLAPLVSKAFLELVSSKHFDNNYIFRAVDGFIVQWGIESPTTIGNNREGKKFPKVDIDPPPNSADDTGNNNILRSNVRGALNFAGGNSATGQVYVNRGTNLHLDNEPGSLPFATLDERSMKIIDSIYSYKEGLGQVKALKIGDDEVKRLFPRMSRIEKCWIQR
jgi:cyclophilin family peptidyl-prolyl cis-trans isomerase